MSKRLLVALVVLALLVASACGDDGPEAADGSTPADTSELDDGEALEGEVTIFAAASLTDAFTALGEAFETANPDVTATFSFGPSSGLREQILAGAPADVFASADLSNVEQVIEAGAASDSEVVATNQLEIAVPPGNPGEVTGLADFAEDDLFIGLCAADVPCGELAREALADAGVTPSLDTEATDVRALLTQISSGDLDAGIVYRTDVLAAGDDVEGIEIPADDLTAEYPIATLTDSDVAELADAFVAFVLSDEGQEILASYGFGAP